MVPCFVWLQEEDSFSTSTLSKIFFEDVLLYTDEFSLDSRKSPNLTQSQSLEESQHEEVKVSSIELCVETFNVWSRHAD